MGIVTYKDGCYSDNEDVALKDVLNTNVATTPGISGSWEAVTATFDVIYTNPYDKPVMLAVIFQSPYKGAMVDCEIVIDETVALICKQAAAGTEELAFVSTTTVVPAKGTYKFTRTNERGTVKSCWLLH